MADNIYLAVDRSNGAIMDAYEELPKEPSSKLDYIEATKVELAILNTMESDILPPGMVVTLTDLEDIRARLAAAALKTSQKALQQPQAGASEGGKATPPVNNKKSVASIKATMKQLTELRKQTRK